MDGGPGVLGDREVAGTGVGAWLLPGHCLGGVTEDCREVAWSLPEVSFALAGRGPLLVLGKTGLTSFDPGLIVSVVHGDVGDRQGDLARRSWVGRIVFAVLQGSGVSG